VTTEDDFQHALDLCPEDHQTRLVFADWLEEHDDPRALGYRALGMCRVHPHPSAISNTWCYTNGNGTTGNGFHLIPVCHRIPSQRWLDLIQDEEYNFFDGPDKYYRGRIPSKNTVLSSCLPTKRRDLEDCAALAFLKLEPAEQRAMLSGEA